MRRIAMVFGAVALAAAAGYGCSEEGATGVGAGLIGVGVRTYEVTLPAEDFLIGDTTYDRIGELGDALFRMVAEDYEGELDAHTLFRVVRPFTATWEDTAGASQTDSVAAIVGGRLTLVIDTLASTAAPVGLEILALAESWHLPTATWTLRYDTADVSAAWTTPGGTPGGLVGGGTWTGGDTLVIEVDSAGAALWNDTLAARQGGVLRATTPDSRLMISGFDFEFLVRPVGADTVVTAGRAAGSKVVADPDTAAPPGPGELRVGGLPAWRSLMRFAPLSNVLIPCPPVVMAEDPDCTVPLNEVTVNFAGLLLHPLPVGAHRIERPIRIESRGVLGAPNVPLTRSPLSSQLGVTRDSLTTALFTGADPDPDRVRVPATAFVQEMTQATEADPAPWEWMALTAVGERSTFGYAAFSGLASATRPELVLVVTVPLGWVSQ